MGTCFSVSVSANDLISTFSFLCGQGYIRDLRENLKALTREMDILKATKHGVENKVAREVDTCRRQELEVVKVWRNHIQRIDLLSYSPIELQRLCFGDLWSNNVCASYDYGKKVFLLLKDVKILKSEGNFEVVTEPTPRSGVQEMPTHFTVGQERMLEKAWNRLMEDEVSIMGLHGMGGVGKTTLFKKIHNKFTSQFRVIWVVVSRGKNISKLQDDIAQKLDLFDEVWTDKNESDKAAEIYKVLKGKRFVLMLDDIWEKVDLDVIGIPFPTRENGCKVAFTTRSQKVCGQMGDHEPMQVNCLEQNEAWELFKTKVGDTILRSDPDILKLARRVAEKCGGLPLALNVIGETMASKGIVQEWEDAVDALTNSTPDFSEMENKILLILKYSYDSLENDNIKSCFLYCALFPEDYRINKADLIDYWICEGFIRESQDLKKATNEGYKIQGTLIRANLLMAAVGTSCVQMHDVVRELALWISSDFGKQKYNVVVQTGMGLNEVPKLKDWDVVKRMSLMENEIEEITCNSKCSELTTLFLQNNNLKNLSAEFIQSMKKLVVLDLDGNHNFNDLPEQISELISLRYLDLSSTSIKQLPIGLQKLKKLIHLNLYNTSTLTSITGISKLSSLRTLELLGSSVHGDVSLVKELQLLKHLQVLNITISVKLGLDQLLRHQKLVKCINGLHILGFQQEPLNISLLVSMENLCNLVVENSLVSGIIIDTKSKESKSPCFSKLFFVTIKQCSSIKDLTWLLFAPNLVQLYIKDSEVEEIINKEKETNLTGIISTPFQKLELLQLENLPKLESIYWSPLPFQVLVNLFAKDCPKLRKFPLNASSAPRIEVFFIQLSPGEQLRDVEWKDLEFSDSEFDEDAKKIIVHAFSSIPHINLEDKDTYNRFFPLIWNAAVDQSCLSFSTAIRQ